MSAMGILHDMQLDYYGKRVAAASTANTVQIWDITDGQQKPAGQLVGHEGPVWKASWAHPKFGSVIATGSYDMKVIIWKEVPANSGNWHIAYTDNSHQASVNDVQFCPWEFGLRLACGSSDGTVSVLTYGGDHQWRRTFFQANPGGVQSISWMPVSCKDASAPGPIRIASGGCDHAVCVWKFEGEEWKQESPLVPPVHTDWVKAVAWRPDAQSAAILASGSADKSVVIWAQEMEGHPWRQVTSLSVAGPVEALSWSVTGSILAVSFGEGETILYKEAFDGKYEKIGDIKESGFTEVPGAIGIAGPPPPSIGSPEIGDKHGVSPAPNEMSMAQQAVLDSFGMS
jgi:protein transport protein SEC13